MSDKASPPTKDAPDSPNVASLKQKRAALIEKKKHIASLPEPAKNSGHDHDAAIERCEAQIKEIDAELKGAK